MMNGSRENNARDLRMLIFITRVEDEKRLEEVFDAQHVPILYQCRGKGTAPSEMLDIFGLSGTTRLVTVGILPRFMARELFRAAGWELGFHRRGGGIGLTVPLTGLQGQVLRLLNDEARSAIEKRIEERIEGDMAEMREKSEYAVVWVSVTNGYSDDVIDAARAAGARGGTVLKGRRRNSERVSQHLGLATQEGQDFVMIVVPRSKKSAVMSAISTACGLTTEAHGVVLSLPVDEVIGLEETVN